jgi:hypothetical protein
MIQTNASMVEFAALMAYVIVEIMLLEIGVKSNQLITGTVTLIITVLNLSMMVVTVAKARASVRTSIDVAKMLLVLLTLVILTATMTQSRMINGSRVAILSMDSM